MIEKMVRMARLFDFYGAMLTENQQKCLELHYLQDWSLGEIAAELGVSRQAINDILRRAEDSLEQYETKLRLAAQDEKRMQQLQKALALLEKVSAENLDGQEQLGQAKILLTEILKQEMGY